MSHRFRLILTHFRIVLDDDVLVILGVSNLHGTGEILTAK
jgi:hypothetical protein